MVLAAPATAQDPPAPVSVAAQLGTTEAGTDHISQVTGVLIADPASFGGNQVHWLSCDQLATLIPPKGYAA